MYYVMAECGPNKGDFVRYTIFIDEVEMEAALANSPCDFAEVAEFETRESLEEWFVGGVYIPVKKEV